MSISIAATPTHQAGETEAKMQKARTLYETKLKAKLEPEFNNKFIAIEPDTEAYAIADKPVLLMKIGPEPETELAIRILGAEALAKVRQK